MDTRIGFDDVANARNRIHLDNNGTIYFIPAVHHKMRLDCPETDAGDRNCTFNIGNWNYHDERVDLEPIKATFMDVLDTKFFINEKVILKKKISVYSLK